VDVGYGQLAWELRNNPKVICMERTNFRYVTREQISEPLDFGAADVSFHIPETYTAAIEKYTEALR
jgi:23S rRNA (cytidine1920-2'-O)/16S rRNA (cytidine1409-2'-O)-methyltransferase